MSIAPVLGNFFLSISHVVGGNRCQSPSITPTCTGVGGVIDKCISLQWSGLVKGLAHETSEVLIRRMKVVGVAKWQITRKMVPIQGERAHSLKLFVCTIRSGWSLKNKIEMRRKQNHRLNNLPRVITFSTDYKYTT